MNNILEATLQIKDKNIIWDVKFKRRYLKRENLYFIQLHIRINQNFVPFVGALAKITILLKRDENFSYHSLFYFRPSGLLKATKAEVSL